jgi:hypothetical protein
MASNHILDAARYGAPAPQRFSDGHAYRQWLFGQVVIERDESIMGFRGRLFDLHYTHSHVERGQEYWIKNNIARRLIREYTERYPMPPTENQTVLTDDPQLTTPPTYFTFQTNTPTPEDAESEFVTFVNGLAESATSQEFPVFELQQNTQAIELRALRERFPTEIHTENYQCSMQTALQTDIENIKHAIRQIRRIQLAHKLFHTREDPREQMILRQLLHDSISSRDISQIASDINIERIHGVSANMARVRQYLGNKALWLQNRARFGSLQAQYHQQAALIRQRPNIPTVIQGKEIIETMKTWENVFAIGVRVDEDENALFVRIGLCDIFMDESGQNCQYDYPASIPLAPFYFTIRINENGTFICPSRDGNVMGLSRHITRNEGMSYDIHPHQLSDQPCFGSFGQTMADLAASGDVLSLAATIIAFYSQYNSVDSAGVHAYEYFPGQDYIAFPADRTTYMQTLARGFDGYDCCFCNYDKLGEAYSRYVDFAHDPPEPAPELSRTHTCTWCEEENVSDNTPHFYDYDGNRICTSCWDNSFCHECERNTEACVCDPDDDAY